MSLISDQPIGIFDSGIGGLTVANAIIKHLPKEKIIYFGDTAHLPYGDKSGEAVLQFSRRITHFLQEKKCKLIIIACNSASSVAYDVLKKELHSSLLVNVIDPVVQAVTTDQKIRKIGIIGTKATIGSSVYEKKINKRSSSKEVVSIATPLLAPMIEAGFFNNTISRNVIESYLSDKRLKDIQALILACTHYPLIRNEIAEYYSNKVKIFDSTDTVAVKVKKILTEKKLLNQDKNPEHRFFVSDYTHSFEQTTRLFYGKQIKLEHCPV